MSTTRASARPVSKLMLHLNFRLKKELSVPSPPAPHLLSSNSAPSDEEKRKIEQALSVARKRASKLRERLAKKTGLPNSTRLLILRTLEQMESFIHVHECILSAFRLLPNEILALIFISCLPDMKSEPLRQRKWSTLSSFRLSQVCGRWRDLAINTPQLWTILGDIQVASKYEMEKSNNNGLYLEFLEELLRRSRELKLSVFFSSSLAGYEGDPHPVINALMKHEPRWEALGIYGYPFIVKEISDPSRPIPASFPNLRRLFLNVTWHLGPDISVWKLIKAPLLTEVTLPNLPSNMVLLPYKKLRVYREKLVGKHVSRKHSLAQAVIQGRNLEELEILSSYDLFCSYDLSATTTVLEKLTTLSLTILTVNRTSQLSKSFLNTLSLPCLEEFRVAGMGSYQASFLTSFVQHAVPQGTGSPLRKLYIRNTTFKPGDLSKFLEVMPNIEELDISFFPEDDLENLIAGRAAEDDTSTPLLMPKLKGLILRFSKHFTDSSRVAFLHKHKNLFSILGKALVDKGVQKDTTSKGPAPYFRLVMPRSSVARAFQLDLNFQNYNTAAYSPEPGDTNSEDMGLRDKFFAWRTRLHQALPELAKGEISTKRTYFNSGFPADFDDLVRELEMLKLSTGRQVANLYVTGLHLTLFHLSKVGDGYIPGDRIYTFRSRVKRILETWDRSILADLKGRKIQWVLKGPHSLMYVGQEDGWHDSLAIKKAVYFGLDDDDVEVWPENIF